MKNTSIHSSLLCPVIFQLGYKKKNPCCWGVYEPDMLKSRQHSLWLSLDADLQLNGLREKLVVRIGIEVQRVSPFSLSHPLYLLAEQCCFVLFLSDCGKHLPSLNIFFTFRDLSSDFLVFYLFIYF